MSTDCNHIIVAYKNPKQDHSSLKTIFKNSKIHYLFENKEEFSNLSCNEILEEIKSRFPSFVCSSQINTAYIVLNGPSHLSALILRHWVYECGVTTWNIISWDSDLRRYVIKDTEKCIL